MVNSKASRWSKDQRLKYEVSKSPGPGAHEHLGNVADANSTAGQFRSIQTRYFGSEARDQGWVARFKTPGPGSYRPPSDFGYVTVVGGSEMKIRPKDRNTDLPVVLESKYKSARKKSIQLTPHKIPASSLMEDIERNELKTKVTRNLKFMRNHVSYLYLFQI